MILDKGYAGSADEELSKNAAFSKAHIRENKADEEVSCQFIALREIFQSLYADQWKSDDLEEAQQVSILSSSFITPRINSFKLNYSC